ncbi:uncharacterized protein C3orf38 homolog [Contarinia nasturtii]|uniref:uncharacterized protein C3orf38 homolog n=1 Tax=Contarinia nasturtii TaxID=265458 RepID=UPI0012D422E7|nr:uncharacterized protein C3orf38 homolog [Contarinia nasturtii]
MNKFANWERLGLINFFNSEAAADTAIPVAKIVSKNMLQTPQTNSEAIDVILLHSSSTESILNRKSIRKGNLFRYLHSKKQSVTSEFTKQLLIEKILQYWKQLYYLSDDDDDGTVNTKNELPQDVQVPASNHNSIATNDHHPEHFPINQMARTFATWFYENLNSNRLQANDFFCDCKCTVRFLENQQILMEEEHLSAQNVLEFCQSLLSKYNLYLNLNISHSGTQGRIDCHGLVLVLTCGSLHKVDQFVGTFEAIFGLSRDPFSQNNWKINQLNLRLHNFNTQQSQNTSLSIEQPTLITSNAIVPLLSLSMPKGDDEIG